MFTFQIKRQPGWWYKWKMVSFDCNNNVQTVTLYLGVQVSILIGHNDLCSYSCNNFFQNIGIWRRVRVEPQGYEKNIRKSLDILSKNLPRTFVVLLAPVDVSLITELQRKPLLCELAHKYECPCLFQDSGQGGVRRVQWLHSQYL